MNRSSDEVLTQTEVIWTETMVIKQRNETTTEVLMLWYTWKQQHEYPSSSTHLNSKYTKGKSIWSHQLVLKSPLHRSGLLQERKLGIQATEGIGKIKLEKYQ